jgi:hypothetical protein
MTGELEVATFTAEAFGRVGHLGSVNWHGAFFYKTASTRNWHFLTMLWECLKQRFMRRGMQPRRFGNGSSGFSFSFLIAL